jgi:hypothetical protein
LEDLAGTADKLLETLGMPSGLPDEPMDYRPNEGTAWLVWLLRGPWRNDLSRLHRLIELSPLWELYLPIGRPSADINLLIDHNLVSKQIRSLAQRALKALPAHLVLLSVLAREARRSEAKLHPDPPHGNVDVLRQELFLRFRRAFKFAFGKPPSVMKDGERKGPAIGWFMAVLKHAAQRRRQVTKGADNIEVLNHLATELTRKTVATYMQEAASLDRKR